MTCNIELLHNALANPISCVLVQVIPGTISTMQTAICECNHGQLYYSTDSHIWPGGYLFTCTTVGSKCQCWTMNEYITYCSPFNEHAAHKKTLWYIINQLNTIRLILCYISCFFNENLNLPSNVAFLTNFVVIIIQQLTAQCCYSLN